MIINEEDLAKDKIDRHKYAMLAGFPNRPKLYSNLFPKEGEEEKQETMYENAPLENFTDIQEIVKILNESLPASESEVR